MFIPGKLYKRINPIPSLDLKFGDVIFVLSVKKQKYNGFIEMIVKFLLKDSVYEILLAEKFWEPVDIEAPL